MQYYTLFLGQQAVRQLETLQFNSEIILRSSSKVMMSILSLIDTENTVQKVLQEFHVGLS